MLWKKSHIQTADLPPCFYNLPLKLILLPCQLRNIFYICLHPFQNAEKHVLHLSLLSLCLEILQYYKVKPCPRISCHVSCQTAITSVKLQQPRISCQTAITAAKLQQPMISCHVSCQTAITAAKLQQFRISCHASCQTAITAAKLQQPRISCLPAVKQPSQLLSCSSPMVLSLQDLHGKTPGCVTGKVRRTKVNNPVLCKWNKQNKNIYLTLALLGSVKQNKVYHSPFNRKRKHRLWYTTYSCCFLTVQYVVLLYLTIHFSEWLFIPGAMKI